VRYDNWKLIFAEQRTPGAMQSWVEPFVRLRVSYIFNMRTDPLERATIRSNTYWDWVIDHLLVPSQKVVGDFRTTFRDYPPRRKAASFTVDQVLVKLEEGIGRH
jgi:arylsulfatase